MRWCPEWSVAELREFVSGEALLWLRMSDDDLKRYGGPEWVSFDAGDLFNTPRRNWRRTNGRSVFPFTCCWSSFPLTDPALPGRPCSSHVGRLG